MDTRFWGPDGWRLLHSIAANYPQRPSKKTKQLYYDFFKTLQLILPCIYCRDSFYQYITELPVENYLENRDTLSHWVYQMHNKVNDKLYNQGLYVEYNRSFPKVYRKYLDFVKNFNEHPCDLPFTVTGATPGWDFMYSVLFNFPTQASFAKKDPKRYQAYLDFFYLLAEITPFKYFKETLKEHLDKYPIEANLTREQLKRWGYTLEREYCKRMQLVCPKYRERCRSVEFFRAGCNGKTDLRPTCHIKNTTW